jgi:hypothetical protein
MAFRQACAVLIGMAVVSHTAAFAWPSTRTPPPFPPKARAARPAKPIAAVGCIQRESDYRREHDRGPGGFMGTSWGLGNEYVLIADCASGTGAAYELTGRHEGQAAQFIGRRVAITGMLKDAETSVKPVGTSGRYAVRPSGGFDPLNQDLRLYEVNVTSYRELRSPVRRFRPIAEAQPDAAVQRAPTVPEAAEQTAPTEPDASSIGTRRDREPGTFSENLPRTASPLPIAGLLGLLSLGGALALRAQRRR